MGGFSITKTFNPSDVVGATLERSNLLRLHGDKEFTIIICSIEKHVKIRTMWWYTLCRNTVVCY
jgi:hypothetical protein